MDGRLIVIEGPDHVGRSLHVRLLANHLEARGVAVTTVGLARSPLLGENLKSKTHDLHALDSRTRSLLYATDLHDQLIHVVNPALEAGFVVLADRYTMTPIIRERMRGGDQAWIESLYAGTPQPDLTVVLSAGPRRLLNRILFGEELQTLNDFEAGMDLNLSPSVTTSFLAYQKMVREAFAKEAEAAGHPVVQTRYDVRDVHRSIWEVAVPVVEHMLQPLV
ncbi:MAG: dTMP kinase [Candidatus Poseidoniaceae archaeon]